MKRMSFVAVLSCVAVFITARTGWAFIGDTSSQGEASAVQSGFYECKRKTPKGVVPVVKVNEDSLLILVNEHQSTDLCACLLFYDGHEHLIARFLTFLSPSDVDEINTCSVVGASAIPAGGLTGVIEVVTTVATGVCPPFGTTLQGGAYGWIKDVVYRKPKANPVDPFSSPGVGIGKTELRVTPVGVNNGNTALGLCAMAPLLPPSVYIENTFE